MKDTLKDRDLMIAWSLMINRFCFTQQSGITRFHRVDLRPKSDRFHQKIFNISHRPWTHEPCLMLSEEGWGCISLTCVPVLHFFFFRLSRTRRRLLPTLLLLMKKISIMMATWCFAISSHLLLLHHRPHGKQVSISKHEYWKSYVYLTRYAT